MAVKLAVSGVGKDYLIRVVDSVTFTAEAGEFVCLLGPNGCGKTTLLRIVGGIEALRDNVALVLKPLGLDREARHARAMDYLRLVGLQGFEDYYPGRVSGGMRQRAAIAPSPSSPTCS